MTPGWKDGQIERQTDRQTDRQTGSQFATNKLDKSPLLAAFRTAAKEHGRLDIVVNNAAIMDEKDWTKTLDVNLVSLRNP